MSKGLLHSGVAFCAGVLIGVAGEAAALVDHGEFRVASVFELRQRNVGTRKLVVAAAAEISDVASRAAFAVNGGVLAVSVVSPAPGVGDGEHNLVAGLALLHRSRLGRYVGVADEAFRAGKKWWAVWFGLQIVTIVEPGLSKAFS